MDRQAPHTLKRWRRAEYDRLIDLGAFQGEPIELIGGELVVAEPQGPYHSSAISVADYALRAALPAGWIVRLQAPVSLDDESEPEPDLAVVPGRPADYRHAHPGGPAIAAALADVDALLTPTAQTPAIPIDQADQKGTAAHFTRPVNYLGRCALALPNGFTAGGLPISLQIVCDPGDEAMALRIGWAYEAATAWTERRPPEPAAR
jgi:hypothetical protein